MEVTHHAIRWTMLMILPIFSGADEFPWRDWWSYGGFSGPSNWGAMNPDWLLCTHGQQQSPIDVNPKALLFDPNLKYLEYSGNMVSGHLINDGRDITIILPNKSQKSIVITAGPLSYDYQVSEIKFHFGNMDDFGSEHSVEGTSFPGEMQIIAFNSDIYGNISHAKPGVNGIVIVSVFIQIGNESAGIFDIVAGNIRNVNKTSDPFLISRLAVRDFLPMTKQFLTYEGSLTQPGCHETVTWILLNKPVYIKRKQMTDLREAMFPSARNKIFDRKESNSRPLQPLRHRSIRTNINFSRKTKDCTMDKKSFYKLNQMYRDDYQNYVPHIPDWIS